MATVSSLAARPVHQSVCSAVAATVSQWVCNVNGVGNSSVLPQAQYLAQVSGPKGRSEGGLLPEPVAGFRVHG